MTIQMYFFSASKCKYIKLTVDLNQLTVIFIE